MLNWILASFKRQLIFMLLGFVVFIGTIVMSKFYLDEKAELYKILSSQASQMSHHFSLSITTNVFYNNFLEISDDIFNLYDYNNKLEVEDGALFSINNIAVLTPDNKVIGHSNPRKHPILSLFADEINSITLNHPSSIQLTWTEDLSLLHLITPIVHSKETIAFLHIEIEPIFLQESLTNLLKNMMLPIAIFSVALIVLSFFFAYWVDKPLLELLQQLNNVGTGKLYFPLVLQRKDEFNTLAKAMINADQRIFTQNNELMIIQKNLEQRVKLRTLELQEKADQLSDTLQNLKASQKQLIEKEKMASLGSLVSGIAHEINTPLGISITGVSHIIDENSIILTAIEQQKLSKSKLLKYIHMVEKMSSSMQLSLKNAAAIISSFKQVAIDQHTEEKRVFNLKTYFDQVIFSLHSRLKNEPVTVVNNIDENLELHSYPGIFSQTLTNFVINSLIHAFNEDTVQGEIIIKGWKTLDDLHITYEDNGGGISEQHINKIFDPFFSTKMGQGGSGLGLNIIYNLINHKLKGNINCKNKTQGMIITIIIPICELQQIKSIE